MKNPFPTTSTTLLANLAERETGIDQAAWNQFFDFYYPVMVEFARVKGAGDDSEDVVQDVLASLVRVFETGLYVRGKGRFRSYLAKMLRNELISRLRRSRVRPEGASVALPDNGVVGCAAESPSPLTSWSAEDEEAFELARRRAAVEHVLTKTALSEQSRRIFREILATGNSCAKVARRMNLPAATVRQVKSRISRMVAAFEKATR